MSRSSSTIRRASISAGVDVLTTMLSIAGVVHDGVNLRGVPSTSTRQIRHAPNGWSLLSWQRVGTLEPAAFAASRIVDPAGTSTFFPSTVTVIRIENYLRFPKESLALCLSCLNGLNSETA